MSLSTTPTQQNADPPPPPPQPINATTDKSTTVITLNPSALPPEADHSSADPHPSQSNDQPPSDSKWDKINDQVRDFLELLPIKVFHIIVIVFRIALSCRSVAKWFSLFDTIIDFLSKEPYFKIIRWLDITIQVFQFIFLLLHILTKKPSTWPKSVSFFKVVVTPLLGLGTMLEFYFFIRGRDGGIPEAVFIPTLALRLIYALLGVLSFLFALRKLYRGIRDKLGQLWTASTNPMPAVLYVPSDNPLAG